MIKYIYSCMVATFFFVAADLRAGPMDVLFESTITTGPSSYESQKRRGFSGGRASFRTKYNNENIVSFRPPSIGASCGSIDIHAGALNFIKDLGNQISTTLRQIAAGAASYAFNLAMSSLCATCQAHLAKLKSTMDKWNQFFKEGCAVGENLAAKAMSPLELEKKIDTENSMVGLAGGAIDEFAEWTADFGKSLITEKANHVGTPNVLKGNVFIIAMEKSKIKNWNFGLAEAGSDGFVYRDLLMSILGTMVMDVDPSATSGETMSSSDQRSKSPIRFTPFPPKIRFTEMFLEKERSGSGDIQMQIYKCNDDDCISPTVESKNWTPLVERILAVMVPANGADLLERYRSKLDLTSAQENLITSQPNDLYMLIEGLARSGIESLGGYSDDGYAKNFSKVIARSLASNMFNDMLRILNAMQLSPDVAGDAQLQNYVTNVRNALIDEKRILDEKLDISRFNELHTSILQANKFRSMLINQ